MNSFLVLHRKLKMKCVFRILKIFSIASKNIVFVKRNWQHFKSYLHHVTLCDDPLIAKPHLHMKELIFRWEISELREGTRSSRVQKWIHLTLDRLHFTDTRLTMLREENNDGSVRLSFRLANVDKSMIRWSSFPRTGFGTE